MRIAISGTHSTGKSTLLEELKKHPLIIQNEFQFAGGITRSIGAKGVKINEEGGDTTQLLAIAKHIENYTLQPSILDRCALDCYCYTIYLYEKGQIKDETLEIVQTMFKKLKYDIIFYLKPEFGIVSDGVRSENNEFQTRVREIFDSVLLSYKVPHITLTGSVAQRLSTMIDAIKQFQNAQHTKQIVIPLDGSNE